MVYGSTTKWFLLFLFLFGIMFSVYYFFYRNIRVIEITPPQEALKQDLGKATEWLQKGGEKATQGTKKAAESVHKAVTSVYHSAEQALSAVTNARTNLETIATTIEKLPQTIKEQTGIIEQLPEYCDNSIKNLDATITFIKQTEQHLVQQSEDINNTLQANPVPEIVQLNKSLQTAFHELEKALTLLASDKEEGVLYTFRKALVRCKQEAHTGEQTIAHNIKVLDTTINHPTNTSAGYLTLPDRIRGVAAVFTPFVEQ